MWRSLPNINFFNAFFVQKLPMRAGQTQYTRVLSFHAGSRRIYFYKGLMQAWLAGVMHLNAHKGHLKGNRSSALL
jgi:hypothetical protein